MALGFPGATRADWPPGHELPLVTRLCGSAEIYRRKTVQMRPLKVSGAFVRCANLCRNVEVLRPRGTAAAEAMYEADHDPPVVGQIYRRHDELFLAVFKIIDHSPVPPR
jgi:hypothetical protein